MHYHALILILFLGLLFSQDTSAQEKTMPTRQDTILAGRYLALANKYTEEASYDSAKFYYQQAKTIYEQQARRFGEARIWEKYVKCCTYLAAAYAETGDPKGALLLLDQTLQTASKEIGKAHREVASIYGNIGNVHYDLGHYNEALEYHTRALAIRQGLRRADPIEMANSYNNLALVHAGKGDYDRALEYHGKSLAIRLEHLGDDDLRVAGSYHNMGVVYDDLGDYDKALEYYNRALMLEQNSYSENHPDIAMSYNNIGVTYDAKGDYDRALAFFQKALAIDLETLGEDNLDVAGSYINIGNVYHKKGDYDRSIEHFERSLAVARRVAGENSLHTAASYNNLGSAYCEKGKYAQAITFYNRCLQNLLPFLGPYHPDVAEAYHGMSRVYSMQHDFENALRYAQKSILAVTLAFDDTNRYANPPLHNVISRTHLLSVLESKAEAFHNLYSFKTKNPRDLETSLNTYTLASDLMDQMRRGLQAEGSKLTLAKQASSLYGKAIQATLQAHQTFKARRYLEKAFTLAEKSKASVLLESLKESQARKFTGIRPEVLMQERNLRIELAYHETEIQKERLKVEGREDERLLQLENRYFKLKREYEKLMSRLEKTYPRYYELKYRAETATVSALQKELDDRTAVLEYFAADSGIYAFAITRTAFEVFVLESSASIDSLLASLSKSLRLISTPDAFVPSAAELYRILIRPVMPQLADKPCWVIIPDGKLHNVPFEALLDEAPTPRGKIDYGKLNYLVRQREISYHYSATLWLRSRSEEAIGSYARDFVAFAPVFSDTMQSGPLFVGYSADFIPLAVAPPDETRPRRAEKLRELKESEAEVQNILALVRQAGKKGEVYLHRQASEANFKTEIAGCKFVHVATHGIIDGENPKLSRLAFAPSQDQSSPEDGFLYSGETYSLDLSADLLTLSSCESGIGLLAKGEGLLALTRGFLYSGARNIIASLWNVYDEHTSKLMVELYRQTLAGKTYSAALREAKLTMIANEATAAPLSWAGFVLIGR